MDFTIRPYIAGDAEPMSELFYQAVRRVASRAYSAEQVAAWAPAAPDPEHLHATASDGRVTLVAVSHTGEAIGYADLEPNGHLDHLFCRPDVVGKGVGGALVQAIIGLARRLGLSQVVTEASELARPVFERHGFQLVERRDFEIRGVPIHNYLMVWTASAGGK